MQSTGNKNSERLEFIASDGTAIVMDLFLASDGPAPLVLLMTPYLRSGNPMGALPIEELLAAGIGCVRADVRGTGESGGAYVGPLGDREIQDGAELIEWLARQSFCTGKVALSGISYSGANQMLIAARRPAGLTCIAPGVGPMDFFRDWTHRGGIPSHTNWAALTFLVRNQPPASTKDALQFYYGVAQPAEVDGELFRERSADYVLDRINVPAFFLGGLFDYFGRATYRCYERLRAPKRLMFGPWGHMNPEDPTDLVNWYRYWLRGEGKREEVAAGVSVYRLGTGEWVHSDRLKTTVQRRFKLADSVVDVPLLASGGSLPLPDVPPPVQIESDLATYSGMHLWGETTTFDLPVETGATVQGLPVLHLQLTSEDCADFDIHARLSLVGEVTTQLTEGRLRASQREIDQQGTVFDEAGEITALRLSHASPTPVPKGELTGFVIEFQPTSFTVPANTRLRLGVSIIRRDFVQSDSTIKMALDSSLVLPTVQ
jgi:hypothetical protein